MAKKETSKMTIKKHLRNLDFWDQFRDLIKIIRSMHEAELMREARNANVIQVCTAIVDIDITENENAN